MAFKHSFFRIAVPGVGAFSSTAGLMEEADYDRKRRSSSLSYVKYLEKVPNPHKYFCSLTAYTISLACQDSSRFEKLRESLIENSREKKKERFEALKKSRGGIVINEKKKEDFLDRSRTFPFRTSHLNVVETEINEFADVLLEWKREFFENKLKTFIEENRAAIDENWKDGIFNEQRIRFVYEEQNYILISISNMSDEEEEELAKTELGIYQLIKHHLCEQSIEYAPEAGSSYKVGGSVVLTDFDNPFEQILRDEPDIMNSRKTGEKIFDLFKRTLDSSKDKLPDLKKDCAFGPIFKDSFGTYVASHVKAHFVIS